MREALDGRNRVVIAIAIGDADDPVGTTETRLGNPLVGGLPAMLNELF